jgi:hypothetical protein
MRIGLIGQTSSGKSSFLNALAGAPIANVCRRGCTLIPEQWNFYYEYLEYQNYDYHSNYHDIYHKNATINDLIGKLRKNKKSLSDKKLKSINRRGTLKLNILSKNFKLIDFAGFNDSGDNENIFMDVIDCNMIECNIMLYVTSADGLIKKNEIDYIKQIANKIKNQNDDGYYTELIIIVNKYDYQNDEMDEMIREAQEKISDIKFFKISSHHLFEHYKFISECDMPEYFKKEYNIEIKKNTYIPNLAMNFPKKMGESPNLAPMIPELLDKNIISSSLINNECYYCHKIFAKRYGLKRHIIYNCKIVKEQNKKLQTIYDELQPTENKGDFDNLIPYLKNNDMRTKEIHHLKNHIYSLIKETKSNEIYDKMEVLKKLTDDVWTMDFIKKISKSDSSQILYEIYKSGVPKDRSDMIQNRFNKRYAKKEKNIMCCYTILIYIAILNKFDHKLSTQLIINVLSCKDAWNFNDFKKRKIKLDYTQDLLDILDIDENKPHRPVDNLLENIDWSNGLKLMPKIIKFAQKPIYEIFIEKQRLTTADNFKELFWLVPLNYEPMMKYISHCTLEDIQKLDQTFWQSISKIGMYLHDYYSVLIHEFINKNISNNDKYLESNKSLNEKMFV